MSASRLTFESIEEDGIIGLVERRVEEDKHFVASARLRKDARQYDETRQR